MKPSSLPWIDVPEEPGWYWYRVNPSTVVRGPSLVIELTGPTTFLSTGVTYQAGLHTWGESLKRVEHYQRSWAGPLPRPEGDEPLILEEDAARKKQERKRRSPVVT